MPKRFASSFLLTAAFTCFAGEALGAGKIVFSKSPIDLKSPAVQASGFKAGDPIYGAIILDAPIKRLCGSKASIYATKETIEIKYYVDEQYVDSGIVTAKGPFFSDSTAIPLDVAPEPARMTAYKEPNLEYHKFGQNYDGAMNFSTSLGGLSGGAHTFRIELSTCGSTIAQGSFRIEGASYASYTELVPALRSEETKGVGMSAPRKVDPALTAAMLKAMQSSSSTAWKDQILRVVIVDPDWFIERHPISGAILFRYIRAEVAVKAGDGKCSFYRLCTFKQDYIGGKFAATYSDGHGDRQPLPCENVGK
jgi:hypothetical protein